MRVLTHGTTMAEELITSLEGLSGNSLWKESVEKVNG
jgi:hypothetical protein